MAQEKFKLPRSSYEELSKIIIAYSKIDKPASLQDVKAASSIATTVVSANNAFLSAVGIVGGGKNKSATESGRKLGQALQHNITVEITKEWQRIVEGNDFLNKMILAVQIRKGMEIGSLEAHVAYSAGEAKAKYVMTGARTVIDILLMTGLVREEDDLIVPTEATVKESISRTMQQPIISEAVVAPIEIPPQSGVLLRIEVHIHAKPTEIDGLGEKLRNLLKSLSGNVSSSEKDLEKSELEG